MRTWALCLLWLCACHRRAPPPAEQGEPLAVASAIAGCSGVADCQRKCTDGSGAACVEAGRLYEFGHAGPRDPERAYGFYDHACALAHAGGCYNQALLLDTGKGAPVDKKRAAALYQRVCALGSRSACARAEELGAAP